LQPAAGTSAPTQTPAVQASVGVHASPSSQGEPLASNWQVAPQQFRIAAVTVDQVAVVALLAGIGDAVAAGDLVGADVDPRTAHARGAIEVGLARAGDECRVAGVDRWGGG
jgi:hypothetical protein